MRSLSVLAFTLLVLLPVVAGAQGPPGGPGTDPSAPGTAAAQADGAQEKPRIWSGSLSAGISVTAGNRNTSNFNTSFELTRDPKTLNVFKTDALYLRGKSENNVTGDQLRFGLSDEYRFNTRFFVFGQVRYLRDRFKDVDYHIAPSTGMGYKVYDTADSSLGFAAGLGGVWEKDRGRGDAPSGSLNIDQKLAQKLSGGAMLTQSIAGIWKTTNFSDSLYTLRATLAASLTQRSQLKVEVLNTYKNRVTAGTKKNDVALITGLVYKI